MSAPDISDSEIRAVVDVLRTGRLSQGPMLEMFENLVAQRVNRPHGIGVSSGTAALHLALVGLDIGPGDEVITPAFSFVASANCVMYTGATPVFADCDPRTLNLRASDVEKLITPKTKAIIGVHVFGNPAGMLELSSLANQYEIELVEDSCEGLGGRKGKDPTGRYGRVAVFGFYPNGQITTGEGGMIVTHDDKLAETCRALRNHSRMAPPLAADMDVVDEDEEVPTSGFGLGHGAGLGSSYVSESIGFNYRLSELNAALGVAQMKRLDSILESRQRVAESYTRRLLGNPNLILPTVEDDTVISWYGYVVRLTDEFSQEDRDSILAGLRRHEVGAASYFPPVPLLPPYARRFNHQPGDFPIAESVSHRTIALPFFSQLSERDIDLVCQTLELMIKRQTFARS